MLCRKRILSKLPYRTQVLVFRPIKFLTYLINFTELRMKKQKKWKAQDLVYGSPNKSLNYLAGQFMLNQFMEPGPFSLLPCPFDEEDVFNCWFFKTIINVIITPSSKAPPIITIEESKNFDGTAEALFSAK